jgi:hypothetical protein
MAISLSRQELYDLVWSKPMTHVSKELGVSPLCRASYYLGLMPECGRSIYRQAVKNV